MKPQPPKAAAANVAAIIHSTIEAIKIIGCCRAISKPKLLRVMILQFSDICKYSFWQGWRDIIRNN